MRPKLHENSYATVFGPPPASVPDHLEDLASELCGQFDPGADEATNRSAMLGFELEVQLTQTDKASVLHSCFQSANENFYEWEDQGDLNPCYGDCYEAQDVFLQLVVEVLNKPVNVSGRPDLPESSIRPKSFGRLLGVKS